MTAIEFRIPTRIVFGAGCLAELGARTAALGRNAWLVAGRSALARDGGLDRVHALLAAAGLEVHRQQVDHEPDTMTVDEGARGARAAGCDVVVGIGGGSVLDTAKAVACLVANGGETIDYLEVVGRGRPVARPAVPVVAVPTTAGTGSEVTRNAVVLDPASGFKASIRDEGMQPAVALLDPSLTLTLPREVTARTGLDAIVQLVEAYVSRRENPMVDPLALEGIARGVRALPRAYDVPDDLDARGDLMLAAAWSGIALAHRGLGVAHAIAGPLGGTHGIPHGLACAALIAPAMEVNLVAAARDPRATDTVRRYAVIARAMGVECAAGSDLERAWLGVAAMERLCRTLEIPALASCGVSAATVPALVAGARRTSSLRANPVELSDGEIARVLERAIG